MSGFLRNNWLLVAGAVVLIVVIPLSLLLMLAAASVFLQRVKGEPTRYAEYVDRTQPGGPAIYPVTAQECEDIANRWLAAARAGDADTLLGLMDFDEMLRRAGQGLQLDDRSASASMKGFKSGLKGQFQQIATQIGKRGSYQLVSIREEDFNHRAVLRLVASDSGLNYHELLVQRQSQGQPHVTDVTIAAAGEPLTSSLHRYLIPIAQQPQKRTQAHQEHIDSIGRTTEMARLQAAGQHEKVLETYRSLPPSRQREKIILIMRLRSAQHLGKESHEAALNELRRFHPDDPCLALASMEYHLAHGDHQQLLEAADALDRAIGGDPYLNLMRIPAFFGLNRIDEAESALAAIKTWDESYYQAQFLFFTTSIVRRDFTEADRHFANLQRDFGYQLSELEGPSQFAEFTGREAYQDWKKSHERP